MAECSIVSTRSTSSSRRPRPATGWRVCCDPSGGCRPAWGGGARFNRVDWRERAASARPSSRGVRSHRAGGWLEPRRARRAGGQMESPFRGLACGNGDATIASGPESLIHAATHPDVVSWSTAVVGAAGLDATLAALNAGKRVALANKESLVMAGDLVAAAAQHGGGELIPIDSEHSAVLQCLVTQGTPPTRLILTASGGRSGPGRLINLRPPPCGGAQSSHVEHGGEGDRGFRHARQQALEVIEAHFLFGLGYRCHRSGGASAEHRARIGGISRRQCPGPDGVPVDGRPDPLRADPSIRLADAGVRRFDPVAAGP